MDKKLTFGPVCEVSSTLQHNVSALSQDVFFSVAATGVTLDRRLLRRLMLPKHIVWKLLKMSHLKFGIFHQLLSDLSANTVWPQASGFQKLSKMDHFWHFYLTFVHSKCKRSSLRSQCWMILFLWFSNSVQNILILGWAESLCWMSSEIFSGSLGRTYR